VYLPPGMYAVDRRSRAMASIGDPGAMPSPGAAMWIPMRHPSALRRTENASSISVVLMSSRLKAAASATGRSAGSSGASCGGKSTPCGKNSCRKRPRWYSWESRSRPQRSMSFAADKPLRRHACSNAFASGLLRSGSYSSSFFSAAISAGQSPFNSLSVQTSIVSCTRFFFSIAASASFKVSSGAGSNLPRPRR